jgi:hypothetical protein
VVELEIDRLRQTVEENLDVGATALAPALRSFFLTASDMWHLYGDLTRTRSVIDRDYPASTCHDIE